MPWNIDVGFFHVTFPGNSLCTSVCTKVKRSWTINILLFCIQQVQLHDNVFYSVLLWHNFMARCLNVGIRRANVVDGRPILDVYWVNVSSLQEISGLQLMFVPFQWLVFEFEIYIEPAQLILHIAINITNSWSVHGSTSSFGFLRLNLDLAYLQ